MKTKSNNVLLVVFICLFIISEAFIVYFIFFKINNTEKALLGMLNDTETKINEKIELNNKDTQSKINALTTSIISLTNSVGSISSVQSNLQKQLGELKASTSADFSGIIESETKGVVTIKTDVSQGTGFLISGEGFVVTNAHVLSGASFANIHTYDNSVYSAKLVGYDSAIDIALLKIKGSFSSLELGDSDDVKIGEKVIAIGNPLGLSFTVTEGIISAVHREGTNNLPYYFQTDASLNPGNSGGPLINTKGKVIGVNNFKISGADNIGFALEINKAIEAINKIALKSLNQTII